MGNLKPLPEALKITKTIIDSEAVSFSCVTDAPRWIRLVSRGNYCAYKNRIYVPVFHYKLVSSPEEEDRNIATAKLLPHIMRIHDNCGSISLFKFLQYLVSYRQQTKYFLYELGYLIATNHPKTDLIRIGFMVSRRNCIWKKVHYDKIEDFIHQELATLH